MAKMKGSEYIIDFLIREDVPYVFEMQENIMKQRHREM